MIVEKPRWVTHGGLAIFSIDVHPDGSRFATAGHDHKIRVWSMLPFAEWTDTGGGGEGVSEEANGSSTKPKLLATLCNHTGPVNCVRWSHQGRHVASASDDQLVLVHERRQGRGTATFGSGEAADVENWKVILTLRGHTSDVIDVAWSPDDAFIASCSLDNTVRIWQAGGGAGGAPVATLSDHRSFVKGVAWDPIDAFVASQSDDKSVLLWRTGDWKLAARVEGPFDKTVGATFFRRLAWSPCGSHLTTTHAFNAPQHTAAVIDRGTWVKGFDFVGHVAPVVAVRYNHRAFCPPPPPPPPPDNSPAKTAVNGDTAGENGELPPAKRARAAEQYNCVAMGSQDCRLSVWTTNRPRPVLIGKHFFTQPVVDLAWSPDGYTLLCCSTDGSVAAFVFTPQELGVMCSPADMDRIKRDRYGDTRVRHVAVAESPALLALEHAAAERLKPAPPPPASAGVVADAPSEVRRPLPPAGPPAATAARSGPSSCAAAAAAGGLAGTAGVDANAGAGASASARHQAAEAPAPPPPPPPPLPSKLPGGSSSSSPARQGVVQQVVEMRADGRRRIVPQPLAVPGGPSAADASHPFGMPAAAGRPPQEPPVAPPPVVGEVGEKRVAAAAALDAHADDDKRRRLSDAPAPPAVAAGHVQLPSRGAGSGAPPVVVAPHRARGEGVLTVHFKPDARDAAQLPTVLEARSGDSDSAGTHVTCSRGGQVMWRDHVAGAAAAAVAGNGKLWAVGMADGALQVYTFHGRRALPLLLLGAAAVVLECDGAWRLLAITAAGDVQLWDLHPSRRARLLKDSVAPLLLRSPDQKLEIASARISRAGAPVVVLSNRHAFMFHLALGTWLQVAHHSFAASQFASVWPTPAHSSDGELASLQAGLAGARGAYGGGAQLTALLDRGRADEKQQTRAHAEDLLAAAEVLQSPHEYRRHLVSYVRVLTKEGDEVRLRELCEHFLGRPSASPSLDEHATILVRG